MDSRKYVGMDVHQASISVAVRDEIGKLVMESILETKASTILEFLHGLRGTIWITFEEDRPSRPFRRSTVVSPWPSRMASLRRCAANS